jgi:hypothetical protein
MLATSFAASSSTPFFSIKTEVDHSQISVGDPITYTVIIQFDKNLKVRKPGPGFGLGEFEIRDYQIDESSLSPSGLVTEKVHYILAIYETGTFFIPSAQAAAIIDGKEVEIKSDLLKIEVLPAETNGAGQLHDIKPEVLPAGYTPTRYYFYMAAPFVLAGIAFLIFWMIKRRREGQKLKIPPHTEAAERLKQLLASVKDPREMYYGFSEIVRRFWERSLKVPCLTMATVQIVEAFKKMEYAHLGFATEFLRYADRVKFAQYVPEKEKTDFFISQFEKILLEAKDKADAEERARLEAKLSR